MGYLRLAAFLAAAVVTAAERLDGISSSSAIDGDSWRFTTAKGAIIQVDFLREDVFRIWAAPAGSALQDELVDGIKDQQGMLNAMNVTTFPKIVDKTDYTPVQVFFNDNGDRYEAKTSKVTMRLFKNPARFELVRPSGEAIVKEIQPIDISPDSTTQYLTGTNDEQIYGGGQQNGNFAFKGKKMQISYSGGWEENDRPSPSPFYISTNGYGILRNTWRNGVYEFGSMTTVTTTHSENRFDAYYFVGDVKTIVDRYTELTGRPHMLARWAYYLGDADCYNDNMQKGSYPPGWSDGPTGTTIDVVQTVGKQYIDSNTPVGWILPNDGYGCGYKDLPETVSQLGSLGIRTGLWTQSKIDRIDWEVGTAGTKVQKLDVAWTGPGKLYSLVANDMAHKGLTRNSNTRGMVWTVMGWAGTQRYAVAWTGDQSGSWDYIRWHIPTFIGSGLSGQAYASSDVDGIFDGSPETYTRDLQFKSMTPVLISMSGWSPKTRKHPWWYEEPYRSINRDYLRLKSALTPYMYTYAHEAELHGYPLTRPMFWEFPSEPKHYDETYKYQYMYGSNLLVAPVYQPMSSNGGFRKNVYLPEGMWFDYFDGTRVLAQKGGRVIDVPITLAKMPIMVRAGAIVPMYPAAVSDDLQPKDQVTLDIYPHGHSTFRMYEDQGDTYAYRGGEHAFTSYEVDAGSETVKDISVTIGAAEGSYKNMPTHKTYTLRVLTQTAPLGITLDGIPLEQGNGPNTWSYDAAARYGTLTVRLPPRSVQSQVSVKIDMDESKPVPTTPQYQDPPQVSEFVRSKVSVVVRPPEQEGSEAELMFDSNPTTHYHSPWFPGDDASKKAPLTFVFDLGYTYSVSAVSYLGREGVNGRVGEYALYLSEDKNVWNEKPTAEGKFDDAYPTDKAPVQTVTFPTVNAKYMKFVAKTGKGGFVAIAELDLMAKLVGGTSKNVEITPDVAGISGIRWQDRTADNQPITMNGLQFNRGLLVEAPSGICMGLQGDWQIFTADVGIADHCKVEGNSVRAMVLVDGRKKFDWTLAGPIVVKPKVDLKKAKTLALIAVNADGSDAGDCVFWANPTITGDREASVRKYDCNCLGDWREGGFSKAGLKIVKNPPEQPGEEFVNAWDGDIQSKYHSPWSITDPSLGVPMDFVVDFGKVYDVSGILYHPRADGGTNGFVKKYEVYLSETGEFGAAAAKGSWAYKKDWLLAAVTPQRARYLKFVALDSVGKFFSAGEFDVVTGSLQCPEDTTAPVLSCPAPFKGTPEQAQAAIVPFLASLKATDQTDVWVTHSTPPTAECGVQTVSFKAVDAFGHESTCNSTFNVVCAPKAPFTVTSESVPRDSADTLCQSMGMVLAPITSANKKTVTDIMHAVSPKKPLRVWVKSWNGDSYGGIPLAFQIPGFAITPAMNGKPIQALCMSV